MAVSLILLIAAGTAAAGGVGAGACGGVKLTEAQRVLEAAYHRHSRNLRQFNKQYKETMNAMDTLGKLELRVLKSFRDFSDAISRIQGRPDFAKLPSHGISLPRYDPIELANVSAGANMLLGGLSGAALGTAGAYAASSATSAAVAAWGTASTGTEIAALSGAAATKATLAALGGGSLAAGGGGIALGTIVLGSAAAGVGILIGGIIFGVIGTKTFEKANIALSEMKNAEKEILDAKQYLEALGKIAKKYAHSMQQVSDVYREHLKGLMVLTEQKRNWSTYTEQEKLLVQNTVLLVELLFSMCKVRLVSKARSAGDSDVDLKAINVNGARSEAERATLLLSNL